MANKKKDDIISQIAAIKGRSNTKSTGTKTKGSKVAKSKEQQSKELGAFAAIAIAAGAATAKSAAKGKNKKNKRVVGVVAFVLVLIILVSGVMFYMDIAPFDFEISGNFFKYYNFPNVSTSSTLTAVDGDEFRLHMIDVGQGDCLLLELPDGKKMLIDGGDRSSALASGIINDYLLSDKLNIKDSNGIVTLDYVMLTHADADHCGSLDDIISSDSIQVKKVFRPMIMSKYASDPLKEFAIREGFEYSTITTGVYNNFVEAVANEEGCVTCYNIKTSDYAPLTGIGYEMNFFYPTEEMYKNISTAADKNNVSPIVILEVYGVKICFTGDADKKQEQNFVNQLSTGSGGFDLNYGDVDILKVGHHGGSESSNQEFLDVVKPEYSLISVGEGNKYGHPTANALTRLSTTCGTNIFRTDIKGNIVVTIPSGANNLELSSFSFGKTGNTSASNGIFRYNFYNAQNMAKQLLVA